MALLTTKQYKTNLGLAHGWITVGLNLSPATEAAQILGREDLGTMCAMSGACGPLCLKFTGMNQFPTHAVARALRTAQLKDKPEETLEQIAHELDLAVGRAKRAKMGIACRLNLLSDQPWMALRLAPRFPQVQFYDYTKLPKPWLRTLPNYHLTFSYNERSSWAEVEDCLAHGINVAVVFNRRKGELPRKYRGIPVIDGDKHDLRFLDKPGRFVGLSFKGALAKLPAAIESGFVLEA
jgi:hypothetical protein